MLSVFEREAHRIGIGCQSSSEIDSVFFPFYLFIFYLSYSVPCRQCSTLYNLCISSGVSKGQLCTVVKVLQLQQLLDQSAGCSPSVGVGN